MARRDLSGAVDFAYLENYAGHDQAIVDEVLDLFREQAALWLPLLDPHAPSDAWRDAAHSLKGSALGVGAGAVAAACAEAEQGAELDASARAARLDRLRDTLDAALADIAAYAHEQALKSLRARP